VSLYDDSDPTEAGYREFWRSRNDSLFESLRGKPGHCPACGLPLECKCRCPK
jgi:hypothetical protein